ncbi:MAG: response regulator transcription factor [Chloroflexi bacterium]|nr:response regulator transcription factor [Chloroflexota bacterium]
MAVTILIVCGDKTAITAYAGLFNKKEYSVFSAQSGRQALAQAKARRFDAIVVDVSGSRINCKNVCHRIKSETSAPMLAITAPNAKLDAALAFAAVVPKPVSGKKLAARVKAAIENKPPRLFKIGALALDLEKRKLTRGSKTFSLTPKEFVLLRFFVSKAGQIVTRKTLMKEIWETEYLGDTRTLDVHIRWLREKIEDKPSEPARLQTVRGQGYRFTI